MSNKKTLKIITTVGTSLFTNFFSDDVQKVVKSSSNDYEDRLEDLKKNFSEDDFISVSETISEAESESKAEAESETSIVSDDLDFLKEKWLIGIDFNNVTGSSEKWKLYPCVLNQNACAEITSIRNIVAEEKDKFDHFEIYLLTTDTRTSHYAASIIKDYLPKYFTSESVVVKEIKPIASLNILDKENFESEGIQNLIQKIDIIQNPEKDKENKKKKKKIDENAETIINITGGYKGIIPIVTIMAQLNDMRMYYQYEDGEFLIETPSLPIYFDWQKLEEYSDFLKEPELSKKCIDYPDLVQEMLDLKLITPIYKRTYLGKILSEYAVAKLPQTGDVYGNHLELKVMEYYCCETYKNIQNDDVIVYPHNLNSAQLDILMDKNPNILNLKTKKNEESESEKESEKEYEINRELDIVLFENREEVTFSTLSNIKNSFYCIEVKPAKKITKALKQVFGQCLNFNKWPKEISILLHGGRTTDDLASDFNDLKKAIDKEFKYSSNTSALLKVVDICELNECTFRIFYTATDRRGKTAHKINYQNFLKEKLTIHTYDYSKHIKKSNNHV